jgi:hypothetical protein
MLYKFKFVFIYLNRDSGENESQKPQTRHFSEKRVHPQGECGWDDCVPIAIKKAI